MLCSVGWDKQKVKEAGKQTDWKGEPTVLQPHASSWEKAMGRIKAVQDLAPTLQRPCHAQETVNQCDCPPPHDQVWGISQGTERLGDQREPEELKGRLLEGKISMGPGT